MLTVLIQSRHRQDSNFRDADDNYLQDKPHLPFRFMDLPTEIRLEIARYIMQFGILPISARVTRIYTGILEFQVQGS